MIKKDNNIIDMGSNMNLDFKNEILLKEGNRVSLYSAETVNTGIKMFYNKYNNSKMRTIAYFDINEANKDFEDINNDR